MPIEKSSSSYSDTKEKIRDKERGEKSRDEKDSAPLSEPVSRVRDVRARLNTVSSTSSARESSSASRPKSVIGGSSFSRDRDREREKDKDIDSKDDTVLETKSSSNPKESKEATPLSKVRSATTISRTSSSSSFKDKTEKPKDEPPADLKLKREASTKLKESPSASTPSVPPASATPAPAKEAPPAHIPESTLKFHIWEDTQSLIAKDKESIIFVAFGVSWCYPAKKSVKNLLRFAENTQDKFTNLKAFIIDEEKNREYCKSNSIIVGTPFLEVYHRGRRLAFSRGEWEPSKVLKGLLNPTQLEEIVNSVLNSVEMGTQEIHVTF